MKDCVKHSKLQKNIRPNLRTTLDPISPPSYKKKAFQRLDNINEEKKNKALSESRISTCPDTFKGGVLPYLAACHKKSEISITKNLSQTSNSLGSDSEFEFFGEKKKDQNLSMDIRSSLDFPCKESHFKNKGNLSLGNDIPKVVKKNENKKSIFRINTNAIGPAMIIPKKKL